MLLAIRAEALVVRVRVTDELATLHPSPLRGLWSDHSHTMYRYSFIQYDSARMFSNPPLLQDNKMSVSFCAMLGNAVKARPVARRFGMSTAQGSTVYGGSYLESFVAHCTFVQLWYGGTVFEAIRITCDIISPRYVTSRTVQR